MVHTFIKQNAQDLNLLASFLGKRDVPQLSAEALKHTINKGAVDVLVLLGSSLIYIADQAAHAVRSGITNTIMISGGIGHSTGYLRDAVRMEPRCSHIAVDDRSEAAILKDILVKVCGVREDCILVEAESTNCGENAHLSVSTLEKYGLRPESILLLQDPTMQLRTHASFMKAAECLDTCLLSYASFIPKVRAVHGKLQFDNDIPGLWSIERFISLVMGEIPRLHDTPDGYGPSGKGFIAHVDIWDDVLEAHQRLSKVFEQELEARKQD